MGDGRSALLVSSTTRRRAALVRALGRAGFRVQTPDRIAQAGAPDLIVALGSTVVLAQVKLLHAVAPHVPIFVAWVDRPEIETWIGYLSGTPAGYFELEAQPGG